MDSNINERDASENATYELINGQDWPLITHLRLRESDHAEGIAVGMVLLGRWRVENDSHTFLIRKVLFFAGHAV